MKQTLTLLTALLLAPLAALAATDTSRKQPNIIVILADDLGYADLGCQGSKDVVSPHIDSIAANGVRLTVGYVSAPQCCPSRAGLITGRYQNRFGFEANWGPRPVGAPVGLPAGERTIADRLKAAGYVTGIVGKWHLGESEAMRPYNRGFNEAFWHPNGGVLFPDKKTGFISNLYRGPEPVQEKAYSTDAFGREACAFIDQHQREPFFLYLAFIPPHWPMEAKPEHLAQFTHIRDLHRRAMLGMMASLDENVGRVLAKLRETKLEENTLLFFLSDNGGPTGKRRPQPDADFEFGQNTSKNDPCRGVKGDLLEGGIRVPFLVQWKGRIPAGRTFDQPTISLDILPTALAAAGVKPQPDWKLDGTNLLPFLTGEKQGAPHDALFWRFRFPPAQPALYRWAIRQGDWKLVKNDREPVALYDLTTDIGETKNLAGKQPDRVAAMLAAYRQWDAQNLEPLWTELRTGITAAHHATVKIFDAEVRMECTGNNPQLLLSDIPSAATGPFTLELKIKSASKGPGQIFWSTAAKPEFSAAQSVKFEAKHDGDKWHDYSVKLPAVSTALTHLRLDPGTAPGLVRLARIVLKDADGKVTKAWVGAAAASTTPEVRDSPLPLRPKRGAAAPHAPCRVGAYYFGMWSPAAFQVIKGFPFQRPDFYLRAETRIQPVYADDGKRIAGYVPQGRVPREDWWMGVRDLWDKERCWPANPADVSDYYLALRKGDFTHLQPVIGYYGLTKPETIRQHIAQARAFGLEFFNFYWFWNSFTRQEEFNTGLEQFLGVDGNPMKFAISICQHGGPFVLWGNEASAARRGKGPSCFDVAIGKLISYVKRDNYLRTSDGRPIIYLLDPEGIVNQKKDAKGKVVGYYEPQGNTIERFIGMLRSEVRKATRHAPLIVLGAKDREYPYQKPDGSMGTVSALAFADAVTRLAPGRGNDKLREDQQKSGLLVMPGFTQNFDERPRYGCIKDPPCLYDPSDSFRKNFQRDLALLKAWMDEQPREESRILSIYAWNEWHEGGIIEPNVRDGARYLELINTVFRLPRNPCDPSLLDPQRPVNHRN